MNDIERNNKTVLELIDILIRSSLDIQRVKELVNLKKELNQPTQPEGYQGLNKWYLTEKGNIIYAVSINEFSCYGLLKSERKWCTGFSLQKSNIQRLATESEITEAILKGCEQHGIVKGVRVHSLRDNLPNPLTTYSNFHYFEEDNAFYIDAIRVFDNGKFAEVVKEEKPTDKELLKECSHLITTVKENMHTTEYIRNLSSHLLTKLNKHLNHE